MNLFFDTEFTGLHKDTTLISIGVVADNDKYFYAEFTDYDENQVNDWLRENVISNLMFNEDDEFYTKLGAYTYVKGTKDQVQVYFLEWLQSLKSENQFTVWSDCLHYDWVLFLDIFGTAFDLPKSIYYIPFDICTLFKMFDIDPDIKREDFIDKPIKGSKHNSLYDAMVIEACHDKLVKNKHQYIERLL